MKIKLILLSFLFVVLFSWVGSAERIDAIKTFDGFIDKTINITCQNSSLQYYGSLNTNNNLSTCFNNEDGLYMYSEIVYGFMWRYNHNLTSELGYEDIYYRNSSLLNHTLAIGNFWGNNDTWQTGSGFVQKAFLSRSLGKAYLESENLYGNRYDFISPVLNLTEDSTYEISGNAVSRDDALFVNFTVPTIENLTRATLVISCGHLGADEEWNVTINGQKSYNFSILDICESGLSSPFGFRDLEINFSDLVIGSNNFTFFEPTIEINDGNNTRFAMEDNLNGSYVDVDWDLDGFGQIVPLNKTAQIHLELVYGETGNWASAIRKWAIAQVQDTNSLNANHYVANQKLNQFQSLTTFANLTGVNYFNDYVQSMFNNNIHYSDGVWEEWSELYASGTGGSNFNIPRGFSSQYQGESLLSLANIHFYNFNQTIRDYILTTVNDSFNISSHFMIYNNNSLNERERTLDNRIQDGQHNFDYENQTDLYGRAEIDFITASNYFTQHSAFASSIANLTNQKFNTISNTSANSALHLAHIGNYWIDYYNFYASNTQDNEDIEIIYSDKSFNNFMNSGLIHVVLPSYTTTISYRGTVPNGGLITNLYDRANSNSLFSARSANSSLFGLGLITDNSGFYNGFDNNSQVTILNNTYPYKINFFGNLTNKSIVANAITYNTTYTFYDHYIEINQSTNSDSELQLWSVSKETIGNGVIKKNEVYVKTKDNSTFYPLNFNLTFQDTTNNATWGVVDKLNASGQSFNYLIQFTNEYPIKRTDDYVLLNNSFTQETIKYILEEKSNLLAYNTNGSIYGSPTINSNDGNINITLPPNNAIYVLDEYNLTQGIQRQNDPIYNGSFMNNTLQETVTFDVYGSSNPAISNGVLSSGTVLTNDQFTIPRGSYANVE